MSVWRIVGIDNGTRLLGISSLEYNFDTQRMRILDMRTLQVDERDAQRRYARTFQVKGANAAHRKWLAEVVKDYVLDVEPDVVAIETPFIGSRKTQSSFEPLSLSLDGLVDVVMDINDEYDLAIDVAKVSPTEAKRAVTPPSEKYDSNKEVVPGNIERHTGIDCNGYDILTEPPDAVDSVAVGYACVVRLAEF